MTQEKDNNSPSTDVLLTTQQEDHILSNCMLEEDKRNFRNNVKRGVFMNIFSGDLSTIAENLISTIGLKVIGIKHEGEERNFTFNFILDKGIKIRVHCNGSHFKADCVINNRTITLDSIVRGVQYNQMCLIHSLDAVAMISTIIKDNPEITANELEQKVDQVYSNINRTEYFTFIRNREVRLREELNNLIRKINVCNYHLEQFRLSKDSRNKEMYENYKNLVNEKIASFINSLLVVNFYRQQEEQRAVELARQKAEIEKQRLIIKQQEEQKAIELAKKEAEIKRQKELEAAKKAQEEAIKRREEKQKRKEIEEKKREEERKKAIELAKKEAEIKRQKELEAAKKAQEEAIKRREEQKQRAIELARQRAEIEKKQSDETNNVKDNHERIKPLNLREFIMNGGNSESLATFVLSIGNLEDRAKYINSLMESAYGVVDNSFMDKFFEHIDNCSKKVKKDTEIQISKQKKEQEKLQRKKIYEEEIRKRLYELAEQKNLKRKANMFDKIQCLEFGHDNVLRRPGSLQSETALKRTRKNMSSPALWIY